MSTPKPEFKTLDAVITFCNSRIAKIKKAARAAPDSKIFNYTPTEEGELKILNAIKNGILKGRRAK